MNPLLGTLSGAGIGLRRTPEQTNGTERLAGVAGRRYLKCGRFGQPGSSPQEQNRFPRGQDGLEFARRRHWDFNPSDSCCFQRTQAAAGAAGIGTMP
jgi:hypothetical protein